MDKKELNLLLEEKLQEIKRILEEENYLLNIKYDHLNKENLNKKLEEIKQLVQNESQDVDVIYVHKWISKSLYNVLWTDVEKEKRKQQKITNLIRGFYVLLMIWFLGFIGYMYQILPQEMELSWEKTEKQIIDWIHSLYLEWAFNNQQYRKILDVYEEKGDVDTVWLQEDIKDQEETKESDMLSVVFETTNNQWDYLEGINISLQDGEYEWVTNDDWKYELELPKWTYTYLIEHSDFESKEWEFEIVQEDLEDWEMINSVELIREDQETQQDEEETDESEEVDEVQEVQTQTTTNINLREGVGTENPIILTIPEWATIQVLDSMVNEEDNEVWYQVEYQGNQWWISSIGVGDDEVF